MDHHVEKITIGLSKQGRISLYLWYIATLLLAYFYSLYLDTGTRDALTITGFMGVISLMRFVPYFRSRLTIDDRGLSIYWPHEHQKFHLQWSEIKEVNLKRTLSGKWLIVELHRPEQFKNKFYGTIRWSLAFRKATRQPVCYIPAQGLEIRAEDLHQLLQERLLYYKYEDQPND